MTSKPIRRIEADGTVVYHDYHRYKPKPAEERIYAKRKPDDPRAVRFLSDWYLPLQLLDDNSREMPETRPDEQILEHGIQCRCVVCRRPEAQALWRARHNLQPGGRFRRG